ncbi:hypothetical protein ASPWEDRAFT_39747 [Aspergillus wentii DTO 134E9]|uniref:Uncharacterized protein n=1 Tax=Aspergillus wentii DTO 134E9 TaxID=1073089 RepID=A0A1L9RIB3_ASPWE|nr:uncharacterized protein ASPWEDRAFT_39747 [Aspergillus wentii DTO 134E9]KAI9932362.1 hypothetical protein MW887_009875 [Aspergillus wentii]OJJ34672.1 hypothetical protein ASPWEDRAFT_39747 [Aspergillus wentii DTO 134E9]
MIVHNSTLRATMNYDPVDGQDRPDPPDVEKQSLEDNQIESEKASWKEAIRNFLHWVFTPLGFLITIYALNIVAWGGMLFLLMCNAAPAMCHPDCNSLNSSRRVWIEIDSQILNALFCVTGFGLAPWRIRDVYFWCLWRLGRTEYRQRGLDRLAVIHKRWFQSPLDMQNLLKGDDASGCAMQSPTPHWKMDVVVWGNMWNTIFQICLALCMWTMNRFKRPSWTTGLFVCLACVVVGVAGLTMELEKRRVKKHTQLYSESK